jgi:hypothetical protein
MTKKNFATNPVRKYRNFVSLSQVAFAKKCGVSVQAIYMTEAGVYETIPDGIKRFLISRDVDWETVLEQYSLFRIGRALENTLVNYNFKLPDPDRTINPIKSFREKSLGIAANKMCVNFLINPGIYRRLEETIDYAQIPETIVRAFRNGGMPMDVIDELNERHKDHFEYVKYIKDKV